MGSGVGESLKMREFVPECSLFLPRLTALSGTSRIIGSGNLLVVEFAGLRYFD